MHTNPNESIGFVFASKIGFVSGFVFVLQKNWDSNSDSDSFSKIGFVSGFVFVLGKICGFEPGFAGFVFVSNPGIRWSLL